jgi:hypothetical protein
MSESPEIPLSSHVFRSTDEALRFLQRARRLVVGVVVVTRTRDASEVPEDDPALAAIAKEARALQEPTLSSAAGEAAMLQEPSA